MQIKKMAVVECGTVGTGIVQTAAQVGIEVSGVVREMAASNLRGAQGPAVRAATLFEQYIRLGWRCRKTGKGIYTDDD